MTNSQSFQSLKSSPRHSSTQKGEMHPGDFELIHSHLVTGLPHLGMYAGGINFAGLYFGTRAEADEESKMDLQTSLTF
jgi:hypothetical protein